MARTDKTAPTWVKAHYDPRFLEEAHDHRNGVCDLPPRPSAPDEAAIRWRGPGSCRWTLSLAYWHSPVARCGCDMCDGTNSEGSRRRRDRRAARRYTRDAWRSEY